jgi:hypothetical protein
MKKIIKRVVLATKYIIKKDEHVRELAWMFLAGLVVALRG